MDKKILKPMEEESSNMQGTETIEAEYNELEEADLGEGPSQLLSQEENRSEQTVELGDESVVDEQDAELVMVESAKDDSVVKATFLKLFKSRVNQQIAIENLEKENAEMDQKIAEVTQALEAEMQANADLDVELARSNEQTTKTIRNLIKCGKGIIAIQDRLEQFDCALRQFKQCLDESSEVIEWHKLGQKQQEEALSEALAELERNMQEKLDIDKENEELQNELAAILAKVEEQKRQQAEQQRRAAEEEEARRQALLAEQQALEEEYIRTKAQYELKVALKMQHEELEQKTLEAEKEKAALETKWQQVKSDVNEQKEILHALEQEKENLEKDVENLRQKDAEQNELIASLQAQQDEKCFKLRNELKEIEEQADKLKQERANLRDELEATKAAHIARLEEENRNLQASLNAANELNEQQQKLADVMKENEELMNSFESLQKKYKDLQAFDAELDQKLAKKTAEAEKWEQKFKNEDEEKLRKEHEARMSDMKKKKEHLITSIAYLREKKPKLLKEIEELEKAQKEIQEIGKKTQKKRQSSSKEAAPSPSKRSFKSPTEPSTSSSSRVVGILKPQNVKEITPKSVRFVGVSSQSSSSFSDDKTANKTQASTSVAISSSPGPSQPEESLTFNQRDIIMKLIKKLGGENSD